MLLSLLSGALVILCSIIAQTINEQIDPRIRAEQAVRDRASVQADLEAARRHVAFIIDGVALALDDESVAAADGDRAAAEVELRLRQLNGIAVPLRLERVEGKQLLVPVLFAAQNAQNELSACKQRRIGVAQLLRKIVHELAEVCRRAPARRLELREARHGAAQAHDRAGDPRNVAAAGVDALGHVRVDRGVGRGNAAVAVRRGVIGGACFDAPVLRAAAQMRERGLQPAAVLVVGRLRDGAVGDGQRRAEIGDAAAAVGDGKFNELAAVCYAQEHLADLIAVRRDGRERIVDELADRLRGRGVVSAEGAEECGAVGGVVKHGGADAGIRVGHSRHSQKILSYFYGLPIVRRAGSAARGGLPWRGRARAARTVHAHSPCSE